MMTDTRRRRRRPRPASIATAALVGAVALAAAACGDSRAETPQRNGPGMGGSERAIPVAAEVVQPREMQVVLRGSANLRARQEVEVLPKQSGVIGRLMVEEGAPVRAGQALAALDSEEWQLQLQQSEARARAARDAAARASQLQQQGLISDQEVERLQSDAAVAEADMGLARLRVRNAVITAPISGVVTHRLIERGQLVNSSTAAFRVADVSRLEAAVGVPEREANRVQPGQAARVRVEGQAPVTGRVARIRPVVDPASGTVQVVVEVDPQQGGGLRPGQFVNVEIVTETLDERLTLPRTAVLVDGATPRVFAVSGGRAQEREVTLGVSQAERVEIQVGVSPGDTVVVVGQSNLRPGVAVNLRELDGRALAETERPQPSPGPSPADGPSLAEIERRLIERGMSAEQAREMAARIQAGERPDGMRGGARPGGGGPPGGGAAGGRTGSGRP
jgi:membrane fusion protein, multidrug efflux system